MQFGLSSLRVLLLLLTILITKDTDKKISGKQATRKQTYWMYWIQGLQNIYHTNSIVSTPFKRTQTFLFLFLLSECSVWFQWDWVPTSFILFIIHQIHSSVFQVQVLSFQSLIHSWYVHGRSPSVVYVLMHLFLETWCVSSITASI